MSTSEKVTKVYLYPREIEPRLQVYLEDKSIYNTYFHTSVIIKMMKEQSNKKKR